MSPGATKWRLTAVAVLAAAGVGAQASSSIPTSNPLSGLALSWRRLGQPSMNVHLAGPASGPVTSVWYSADGGTLLIRTESGHAFQTADLENWTRSQATRPDTPRTAVPPNWPESQAQIILASGDTRRTWALGRNLFVSEDGGTSWTNISGSGVSVIGAGQHDIAVSPRDSAKLAVVNDFGVWQSQDGGQSWAGLNDSLPNLPITRIVSTTAGGVKVALDDGRTLQLTDARAPWSVASSANLLALETRDHQRLGRILTAEITASAHSGDYVYAGSSDGRVWVSRDRGATWTTPQSAGRGPVERFYVDADAPRAAIAMLSGSGARIVRTVNAGAVWDDVTGNLADVAVHGAAADRASGIAYVATDRGVYMARIDLNAFTPPSAWTSLSRSLPPSRAMDVALDASVGQLFVALEGYGLYTASAPVRNGALRLANAADFSNRPAAPGSVVSVIGGKVNGARAGDLRFPLLASGDSESQLQVPFETRTATVDLEIDAASGRSTLPLSVRNVSPAIFVDHDGSAFLVDADTGLALESSASMHPRARLQLMATGLGRVQPEWPTGVAAPFENAPAVVVGVQGYLDGIPIEVIKATLAPGYIGYYLVELQLPAVLNAGPAELYLMADGHQSNKVRVEVDSQ